MKKFALGVLVALPLLACNTITQGLGLQGGPTPVVAVTVPAPLETPVVGTEPPPTLVPFKLELESVKGSDPDCSQSPFGLPADKIVEVAYVPSGFCFNGEIDTFEIGDQLYVVQSLGTEGAFFITNVTNPQKPSIVGEWQWNDFPYTADVKAFKQGDKRFIVLSLEPAASQLCGVAIVEVTDPANPQLLGNYTSENTGSNTEGAVNWCDTHTAEVTTDTNGDGAFIYVSSIETSDLRVLDIRDLRQIKEINHYTHPEASGTFTFVHDTTIVRGRVYVSYWSGGVMILDQKQVEAGDPIVPLNPVGSIMPKELQIHHAYPTEDDQFLFVEDEVNYDGDRSQLRLFDIRDLQHPKEIMAIKLDNPLSSPHNLLVAGNLLYVGWYTDGVRVFKYDDTNPEDVTVEPYAFKSTRPGKTQGVFGSDIYDSIYGVRLHPCQVDGQDLTCIYASDLTRGLLILAIPPE